MPAQILTNLDRIKFFEDVRKKTTEDLNELQKKNTEARMHLMAKDVEIKRHNLSRLVNTRS